VTPLLQETVAAQAARRPDATALVMGESRMTYAELEERSSRLAHLLLEQGCRPGDRICLFVPKTPEAIVGMIAVLKARCAYVPIDLASPAPRVRMIVDAAQPRLALAMDEAVTLIDDLIESDAGTEPAWGSLHHEALEGERFRTAFSQADAASFSAEPPSERGRPEDLAHILFTSGSTGIPKGVMITHRNVFHFVDWATSYFGTSATDRISGHPPLHFDLSTFDIYGTFLAGAELHLVPTLANLLPQRLAALIRDSQLTQWFAVPSIFTYMAKFDVIAQDDFPALERVLWCGEVLPTPILIHWMGRLPHATFTNLYGPTEATIASSYHTVSEIPKSETQPIPIGTACGGEELLVLDEGLHPSPAGETGDLYIGGVGLSPGYWRDEEKTEAAFIVDTRSPGGARRIYRTGDLAQVGDDCLVYFLGRADSQIKHRGYRIELGEIEVALNSFADLRECAVVAVESPGFAGTTICCAYAPANGRVEPSGLRAELGRSLPSYMLPSRWLALEALPKNVNDKIDRRAVRELFARDAG
jgi:amino acid adenylation domain-containing protein